MFSFLLDSLQNATKVQHLDNVYYIEDQCNL